MRLESCLHIPFKRLVLFWSTCSPQQSLPHFNSWVTLKWNTSPWHGKQEAMAWSPPFTFIICSHTLSTLTYSSSVWPPCLCVYPALCLEGTFSPLPLARPYFTSRFSSNVNFLTPFLASPPSWVRHSLSCLNPPGTSTYVALLRSPMITIGLLFWHSH